MYWKPVHHVLSGGFEVIVCNAIKPQRGKKTDKADAEWIAEKPAHDQIPPSVVPSARIAALGDLTRMRVALLKERTQAKNRVHRLLEDAHVKFGCMLSDIFGKSGRKMLRALVAGERDVKVPSKLAMGTARRKIPELEDALTGYFTDQHALLNGMSLDLINMLDGQVAALEEQIEQQIAPLRAEIDALDGIPGVDRKAAAVLAEVGRDMSLFGSESRLASWAGICPGNSAGKRYSGKTRKGNRYLKRVLVECAWAAARTPSLLGHTYRRLQYKTGKKKAAVAVGHKILVIAYHVLSNRGSYDEDRYRLARQRDDMRWLKGLAKSLERRGYNVKIEKAA